jgi:hypothetical protein
MPYDRFVMAYISRKGNPLCATDVAEPAVAGSSFRMNPRYVPLIVNRKSWATQLIHESAAFGAKRVDLGNLETVHRLVPRKRWRKSEEQNRNQGGTHRRRDRENIDQNDKRGIAEYPAEAENG